MQTDIQCMHCSEVRDSKVTINKTVDLMKKHVKDKHPSKDQFR